MRQGFLHPRSVVWIALIAFGLRLAVGAWFESRLPAGKQFEFGDSDGYWILGQTIAAGETYQYKSPDARIFRMPGYPALLAPIFWIAGPTASPMWGRALSAVFGGATAALVAWWGTLIFDLRTGLIAGWITAFYPGAIAMGAFVLSEAPFCLLMVAQLALWAAAWKTASTRPRVLLLVAAGLAGAGAIYMRPSWLLFVPFAALNKIVLCRERFTVIWQSAIICAIIAICLAPWWIRNYQVCGQFVPTTLQVGASLYDGLNPDADGSSNMTFVFWRTVTLGHWLTTKDKKEFVENVLLRQKAIAWAKENPIRVIQLAGIKFFRLWNVVPNEPMFRSWPIKLGVFLTFTPLFVLGLYGVTKFSRLGWPYLLCGLPALYFTLLHIVFVASVRYREPAMLGLIVLASAVIRGAGPVAGGKWRVASKQNRATTDPET